MVPRRYSGGTQEVPRRYPVGTKTQCPRGNPTDQSECGRLESRRRRYTFHWNKCREPGRLERHGESWHRLVTRSLPSGLRGPAVKHRAARCSPALTLGPRQSLTTHIIMW